jgi:RecA/RadA recombinase
MRDDTNPLFSLAADFIEHTSRSVFLTGKAGTGKTTFLRHISATSKKNFAIAAPTGVAAINAGGMTLHSLFQLPFGVYLPGYHLADTSIQITNRNSLFKNLHLSKTKREVIQEMDLLIIDEISMVRCDMLDAVDTILKAVRRSQLPFGGVQVLFIGDLYQLSPVAKSDEWAVLKEHYESPFFFHAKVMEDAKPLNIELSKIYRQNEQSFIDLLNNIRQGEVTTEDLNMLNSRLHHQSISGAITLTTHNHKADTINEEALTNLGGESFKFKAIVEGDFPDKSYPTDDLLVIKKGARVMFIKNDSGDERKYYNGKMATVTHVDKDAVEVEFDEGITFDLTRETWRNIRYTYQTEADEIDEEELGTFTQYPIRLAWAITIHKSQGLTFEKAVIDAGNAFAPGQVYVALSRCTSLDGLVLQTPIAHRQIMTDPQVIRYSTNLKTISELNQLLETEKSIHTKLQITRSFSFSKIREAISVWAAAIGEQKSPDTKAIQLSGKLMAKAMSLDELADKTRAWLERKSEGAQTEEAAQVFEQGLRKSIEHFYELLHNDFYLPLQEHEVSFKDKKKVKKKLKEVLHLIGIVRMHAQRLCAIFLEDEIMFDGKPGYFAAAAPEKEKPNVNSAWESKLLFDKGISLTNIASVRGLAVTTIEGHIAQFIKTGDVNIKKMVSDEKVCAIQAAFQELQTTSLTAVKEKLGDDFSYGEIRMVFNYMEYLKLN